MFFAPIRPNNKILRHLSFIASLIISILGFRLGSILIILMSSMPPQLSETFELLISILAFRLGSGLIILMQLLRSGGNILHNIHIWTYYFKWTGDIEIGIRYHPGPLTSAIRKSSILGFRLGSDLIILMPEFHPRFPPRPKGPTLTKPLPFKQKTLDFQPAWFPS